MADNPLFPSHIAACYYKLPFVRRRTNSIFRLCAHPSIIRRGWMDIVERILRARAIRSPANQKATTIYPSTTHSRQIVEGKNGFCNHFFKKGSLLIWQLKSIIPFILHAGKWVDKGKRELKGTLFLVLLHRRRAVSFCVVAEGKHEKCSSVIFIYKENRSSL